MALSALSEEQIRLLDQGRQRLSALLASVRALQAELAGSPLLPLPSSLQVHANLIAGTLQTVSQHMAEHQDLFSSVVAAPAPKFPPQHQDSILQTLLRTKLEPTIEDWIDEGRSYAHRGRNGTTLSDSDRRELWDWAPRAANDEAKKQKWEADYTLAEKRMGVENVITGLRRTLVEPPDEEPDDDDEEEDGMSEEDDEEDEDEKMEEVMPKTEDRSRTQVETAATVRQMPLEHILKFMTTGQIG